MPLVILIAHFSFGEEIAISKEPGVLFTFDDRFISQWSAQLPLFAKYNAHATFFISGFYLLDSGQRSTLQTMKAAGPAIGCHSVNHLNAVDYAMCLYS